MKRSNALSIGQIIDRAIAATGRQDEYLRGQICYLWQEVVGPGINRYTTRRWIDRDILHVCITSAPLKNELSFCTASLVKKLNEAVGSHVISNIVIH